MAGINDLIKCPNGHYYDKTAKACPYCPPGTPQSGANETQQVEPDSQTAGDSMKTFVPGQNQSAETFTPGGQGFNNDPAKTFVPGGGNFTEQQRTQQDLGAQPDFSKTYIPGMEMVQNSDGSREVKETAREYRKLVGWLVTYDIDPAGTDYKLYEGKNFIGSSAEQSITVPHSTVSRLHATILFRNGKYRIKDEFSTAGTYINGVEVEEDTKLADGDEIKVGQITMKFRSSL